MTLIIHFLDKRFEGKINFDLDKQLFPKDDEEGTANERIPLVHKDDNYSIRITDDRITESEVNNIMEIFTTKRYNDIKEIFSLFKGHNSLSVLCILMKISDYIYMPEFSESASREIANLILDSKNVDNIRTSLCEQAQESNSN
jgi:hypothetical protein